MSSVQVPAVTLDDLQAFHAKHFPWAQPASAPAYPTDETVVEEQAEEDDLGYYPDGVKRTLTDEQIKIFRHSEIHALLREKQLREEELAEESSEPIPENEKEQSVTPESGVKHTPAPVANQESSSQGGLTTAKKPQENNSSSITLDYGEGSGSGNQCIPAGRPPFAGRRIISYDD